MFATALELIGSSKRYVSATQGTSSYTITRVLNKTATTQISKLPPHVKDLLIPSTYELNAAVLGLARPPPGSGTITEFGG